jgi:SAM-dependent methyltransferase
MPLLAPLIRRQRTAMVTPWIRGDVLEIGCQDAATLEQPTSELGRYVGTDIDEVALARARERYPDREFRCCDVESDDLGFREEFDTVLLVALIEHILNQRHLLEQCKRALRPGGHVVLTTPTPFGNDVVHRLGARVGLFHRTVEDVHVVIYDRRRLKAAATLVGLTLERHHYFQLRCNQLAVLRKPG